MAESPPPDRYRFEMAPDSAGLQGCFSTRRRVSGVVDRQTGRAVLEVDQVGVAAMIGDGVTYVHRNALGGWPVATDWVALSRPVDERAAEALTTSLGSDLTEFVLAFELPDPPTAFAAAAVETMRSARLLDPTEGDDAGTKRIEVDIDTTKLAQESLTTTSGVNAVPLTVVFVLNERGEVAAVSARLSPQATATDDEPFGYRITYTTEEDLASVPAVPDAADVTPIEAVSIPESPPPPDIACTVGP